MVQEKAIQTLIADDHPLILSGLEKELVRIPTIRVVERVNDGTQALDFIKRVQPDLAILDIQMPEMSGLEVADHCKINKLSTKIILLTMFHELSFIKKAEQLNVKGYLLKDAIIEELIPCVEAVINGENYLSNSLKKVHSIHEEKNKHLANLSRMEKKVFQLIAEELSTKQIAELLYLSPRTVDNHRHNIIKKLKLPTENNSLLKYALANK